jgi:hypothetical protein
MCPASDGARQKVTQENGAATMLQSRFESHDRPDSSREILSDRAVTALRTALQAQLKQPIQEASLRRALRAVCFEARMKNMRAEQLIVVFKRVWFSLPEVQGKDSPKREEILDRIVTVCVDEFYAA